MGKHHSDLPDLNPSKKEAPPPWYATISWPTPADWVGGGALVLGMVGALMFWGGLH